MAGSCAPQGARPGRADGVPRRARPSAWSVQENACRGTAPRRTPGNYPPPRRRGRRPGARSL